MKYIHIGQDIQVALVRSHRSPFAQANKALDRRPVADGRPDKEEMALTLVSTTATERLLRHVESLSEAEAQDALRMLVERREQVMSMHRMGSRRRAGGLDHDSRQSRSIGSA